MVNYYFQVLSALQAGEEEKRYGSMHIFIINFLEEHRVEHQPDETQENNSLEVGLYYEKRS